MMRENIRESYTLDQLSVLSGLSSSHFRALFKERTGMTAVQFQNHLKIDRAKDLILSRDCNVTEAAYAVGFNDVYYFSRMFRKLTGKPQNLSVNSVNILLLKFLLLTEFFRFHIPFRNLCCLLRFLRTQYFQFLLENNNLCLRLLF